MPKNDFVLSYFDPDLAKMQVPVLAGGLYKKRAQPKLPVPSSVNESVFRKQQKDEWRKAKKPYKQAGAIKDEERRDVIRTRRRNLSSRMAALPALKRRKAELAGGRATGLRETILTGPVGILGDAPGRRKTLLGL